MYDDEKPSLEELIHFGKLGMHWGKHKSNNTTKINKKKQLE